MVEKIVKRFELIILAIELDESKIIDSQIDRLRSFNLSNEAENIVNLLERHSYEQASTRIKTYIKKLSDIGAYKDPKLGELQIQLKTLERDFNSLLEEKNEYLATMLEYESLFHKNLDSTLEEILKKRYESAKDAYGKGKLDTNVYNSIKNHYLEFEKSKKSYESEEQFQLNDYEKKELKNLYKKANKKINPDILLERFRKRTQKMFLALNNAYKRRDLTTIKKIQKSIEKNQQSVYGYDNIDDMDALRKQSKSLRRKIKELKQGLEKIKNSEIHTLLQSTDDLEYYFKTIQKRLLGKKEKLLQIL